MDFRDANHSKQDDAEPAEDIECDEEDEVEYAVDDSPMQVVPGLFIGSAWAEMNEPALTRAGITDILQVAQGLFPRHPMLFTYMILQVEDAPSTDLVRYFPKCFEFIDKALSKGGSVLVHCAAGVSRSATVVLGYLMARHNFTMAAALEHLKAVRPWVAPNPGFLQQLAAYEAAKCDLSEWTPWHLVWHEQPQQQQQQQQQQQDQHMAAMELLSLPPQPQQWLRLPQPCDRSSSGKQQEGGPAQQQRCCCSSPAAEGGAGGAGAAAAAASAASSSTHAHSLPAAGAAAGSSPRGSNSAGCATTNRNGFVSNTQHTTAAAAAVAGAGGPAVQHQPVGNQ